MSTTLVIILSALALLLPLTSIVWLWRRKGRDKTTRFLKLSIATCAVLFAYLAGLWAFYSYYLRFIIAAIFIISFYRYLAIPSKHITKKLNRFALACGFSILSVFVLLNMLVVAGYFHGKNPVELSFPLRNGTYYVIQGGNSKVTNLFHGLYKTINALDIVKLKRTGNRANSLFPKTLSSYAIFGETIYSPCDGKVIRAVDGLPDLVPPLVDRSNASGNHVVIECKGVKVLLAHMMNGSVTVKKGNILREGQPLGRVGNSGNTFEPHLHIHAARTSDESLRGPSVPILFDDRFLSLNSLVKSNN